MVSTYFHSLLLRVLKIFNGSHRWHQGSPPPRWHQQTPSRGLSPGRRQQVLPRFASLLKISNPRGARCKDLLPFKGSTQMASDLRSGSRCCRDSPLFCVENIQSKRREVLQGGRICFLLKDPQRRQQVLLRFPSLRWKYPRDVIASKEVRTEH